MWASGVCEVYLLLESVCCIKQMLSKNSEVGFIAPDSLRMETLDLAPSLLNYLSLSQTSHVVQLPV